MTWPLLVLCTSVLLSSGVPEVYNYERPITFTQTYTVDNQRDLSVNQEYNKETLNGSTVKQFSFELQTSDSFGDDNTDSPGTVSDNELIDPDDNEPDPEEETAIDYTGEFTELQGKIQANTDAVELLKSQVDNIHEIEVTKSDLLTYICGILLFLLLCELLRYIYKFFKMFF